MNSKNSKGSKGSKGGRMGSKGSAYTEATVFVAPEEPLTTTVAKLVSCRCCTHYLFRAGQRAVDRMLHGSLPVVVATMVLNDAVNRNILSAVYPIAVFGFLLVHNPRQLPVLPSMLSSRSAVLALEESRQVRHTIHSLCSNACFDGSIAH